MRNKQAKRTNTKRFLFQCSYFFFWLLVFRTSAGPLGPRARHPYANNIHIGT